MSLSNNPPDMAATAAETMQSLSDWMKEHPVIEQEEDAREAKVLIDRGKLCIKDLEDERDKKVRPLNQQVKEINEYYRSPRENLQAVLNEINSRITAWLREEERKRQAAAEEARRQAEEAVRRAQEAERLQREADENARGGELGVDIAAATVDASEAARDAARAVRVAARAEREVNVRVGGGFSRAIGLRTEVKVEVVDAFDAIEVIGLTPDIEEAICKAARAFHRLHKQWPPGIHVKEERKA